jgi:hypothetical protein
VADWRQRRGSDPSVAEQVPKDQSRLDTRQFNRRFLF